MAQSLLNKKRHKVFTSVILCVVFTVLAGCATDFSRAALSHREQMGSLARDGAGGVFRVWQEEGIPGIPSIVFTRSRDGGMSFSPPRLMSDPLFPSYHPRLALGQGGSMYVVWSAVTPRHPGNGEIFFSRSTDGGETFSEPLVLSNASDHSSSPVAARGKEGEVSVVWEGGPPFSRSVYVARSTDHGRSFSRPTVFSRFSRGSVSDIIAISQYGQ